MSRLDSEQTIYDHGALLILVKHVGSELSTHNFTRLFGRIKRVSFIKITDRNDYERIIRTRFVSDYPVENNDWGEIQTHRRLLGLITLGKCSDEHEFNEIHDSYQSLKETYHKSLLNSHCVIFSANAEKFQTTKASEFRSQITYFELGCDLNSSFQKYIREFVESLFWIVEAGRITEQVIQKTGQISTDLVAPCEDEECCPELGAKMQTKRRKARHKKLMADLSLQTGLLKEALSLYYSAMRSLKLTGDRLWMASCVEGLCAVSARLMLSEPECIYPSNSNELTVGEMILWYGKASLDKAAQSFLETKRILLPEEIFQQYTEAITFYSMCKKANIIKTEAVLKGARFAIKYHFSSNQIYSLLQCLADTELNLQGNEEIQFFLTLSRLYTEIGYHRKASFYRILTAVYSISAKNPPISDEHSYFLVLRSLPFYKITLATPEQQTKENEWPSLQCEVLRHLVDAASFCGRNDLATRHVKFLLQTMWDHMSLEERMEAAMKLNKLTKLCIASKEPIVLNNGCIIPPANLINIPQPLNFVAQNMKAELIPHKLRTCKVDYGPFLFTPLTLNPGNQDRKKSITKLEYLWVVGEPCEVILEIANPLLTHLEVSNITLLTNGVAFKKIPVSATVPVEFPNQSIVLSGIPMEAGELEIRGYSLRVLGVESDIKLSSIPNIPQNRLTVEVVPALSILEMSTLSDPVGFKKTGKAAIIIYVGETYKWSIQLKNTSSWPVEFLEVTIDSCLEANIQKEIMQLNEKVIQDQMPILPGTTVNFSVNIFGAVNLMNQTLSAISHDCAAGGTMSSSSSFTQIATPRKQSSALSRSPSIFSFRSLIGSLFSATTQKTTISGIELKETEFQLKVKYSGGPGFKSDYCRICSAVLDIEILSAVVLTGWEVQPGETNSTFYLILDITNRTEHDIGLIYSKNKFTIQLEEGGTRQISILLDRCSLSLSERIYSLCSNTPVDGYEINELCCEQITSQVDILWKIYSLNREGHVSLKEIRLYPRFFNNVLATPVDCEILVNRIPVKNTVLFSHPLGEVLHIGIWVHNLLPRPLKIFLLHFYFFQDQYNNRIDKQLDDCLTTIGSTDVNWPLIPENGKKYHECSVIFYNTGQYKLDLQCCISEENVWKLMPSIQINVVDLE